jgi:glycosyltransferase involved in cell wall biosynthesis
MAKGIVKILVAHNAYRQRGGEDRVVEAETKLLEERGHSVVRYARHNDELRSSGPLGTLSAGVETVWAASSYQELKKLIAQEKPDVAHFHNTFPLISPAAYYACAKAGVPVVQTLHNYRLLCPGAMLLRDGRVCEACLGRGVPWPGVVHGCYRGSRAATSAVATMLTVHNAMGTWQEKISVYVALSEFARRKFIEGGLPAKHIVVKPNFVAPDPGLKQAAGEYALYVGRLSEEKGIRLLLSAWHLLRDPIPLRIAGAGRLQDEAAAEICRMKLLGVEFLGPLSPRKIIELMHRASFLVVPSICFENFPLAVAEAFACGLPVIASRIGSLTEIITDGTTGLHVLPGNAQDLAAKIEFAWEHPEILELLGRAARAEFERKYQASSNFEMLMHIYEMAMGTSRKRPAALAAAG